jgi:RNase adaptor protein for sRNA GlmZ degradation
MSVTIYTGSRKMVMTVVPDLEYNVADMGIQLLDFNGSCRRIWDLLDKEIRSKVQELSDEKRREKTVIVLIGCEHGQERSVETAKALKKFYLKDLSVTLRHVSLEKGKALPDKQK